MARMGALIRRLEEGYRYNGPKAAEARNAILGANPDPSVKFDRQAVLALQYPLVQRGNVPEQEARQNAAKMIEGLIEVEVVRTKRKLALGVVMGIVRQMLADQGVTVGRAEEPAWIELGQAVAARAATHMGLTR